MLNYIYCVVLCNFVFCWCGFSKNYFIQSFYNVTAHLSFYFGVGTRFAAIVL